MPGSGTTRVHRHRWRAVAVATAAALLLLTSPAAAQDVPPVIAAATISPASLPSIGGTVTVTAAVTDDLGVFWVEANVYGPGSFLTAPMLPTDEAGTYSGTLDLPANHAVDAVHHQIQVVATDSTSATATAYIGDVEVRGNPPFDAKPVVSDPSVAPTSLPVSGGLVQLGLTASDAGGISEAYAAITGPTGAIENVALGAIGGDRFTGTFAAPANTSIFPAYYEIAFHAVDDIGQHTVVGGERVTVAARPTGRLEIHPAKADFGNVKRGRTGQRAIVVRNVGAKGTLPVSGLVQTSGAPFFLVGQTNAGIAFSLKPGESRTLHVEFRPAALGLFAGRVNVVRTDGGQAFLHVPATGRGT
jgi:hypothetical protein